MDRSGTFRDFFGIASGCFRVFFGFFRDLKINDLILGLLMLQFVGVYAINLQNSITSLHASPISNATWVDLKTVRDFYFEKYRKI